MTAADMSVAYGKGPKGKATKLHAQLVRSRGHCENCWKLTDIQCAHIVSRTYAWTRTDESNAFALCGHCHERFTRFADEWMEFIARTIGLDEYLRLKHKAIEGVRRKFDWDAEVIRLQALMKEIA